MLLYYWRAGPGEEPAFAGVSWVRPQPDDAGIASRGIGSMTCREFLARHSDYLDGELTSEDAARVAAHAAACPSCARYDRVLRRGLALVRQATPVEPTYEPYIGLQEHLARAGGRRPSSGGAVLATLAVAGVVAMLAWTVRLDSPDGYASRPAVEMEPPLLDAAIPWGGSDLSGTDVIGPALASGRGRSGAPTFADPTLLPTARSLRFPGAYSPLLLDPPDYGQSSRVTRPVATSYSRD